MPPITDAHLGTLTSSTSARFITTPEQDAWLIELETVLNPKHSDFILGADELLAYMARTPAAQANIDAKSADKIETAPASFGGRSSQQNKGSKGVAGVAPPVAFSHTPNHPTKHTPQGTPQAHPHTSTKNGKGTPKGVTHTTTSPTPANLPRWRDLSDQEKFGAAARHAQANNGLALSLNLSIGREGSMLNQNAAIGARRRFQLLLNRSLKAEGLSGLAHGLKFELSKSDQGKLHIHGVVIPGQHDLAAIERAFRRAAGLTDDGLAHARQFRLDQIHNADGWARYLKKALRATRRALGGDTPFLMSHSMIRAAEAHHAEARSSANRRAM